MVIVIARFPHPNPPPIWERGKALVLIPSPKLGEG
jgi:hypothetical protein